MQQSIKPDEVAPPKLQILAFGQGLSVLMALMWASQSTLFLKCKWTSPAFSCGWAYLLLSFYLIPLTMKGRAIRKDKDSTTSVSHWFLGCIPLHVSPWAYLGMAVLSFYGYYCYLLAVTYTTITSISLLDAMSIPTAMILSHLFLKRRYLRLHLLGATLCIIGVVLDVSVDLVSNRIYQLDDAAAAVQIKVNSNVTELSDGSQEYPHKIVGDLLSVLAAILFGANDVLAELSVRRLGGTTEYLGMVGFFGFFIAVAQVAISERQTVLEILQGTSGSCAGDMTGGLLVAYIVGQFSRNAGLASFLTMSDAAMLQLSLLTSDFYTAIFSILVENIRPRASAYAAMVLVIFGIVLYEAAPPPGVDRQTPADEKKQSGATSEYTPEQIDFLRGVLPDRPPSSKMV